MPRIPQAAQQVPSSLIFDPSWVADPGPEVWRIVDSLDVRQQARFAETVLATRIAVAEAHLAGMKQIQKAIGGLQP